MDKERTKSNNHFIKIKGSIFFLLIFLCGCNTIQERIYWSRFDGAKEDGECVIYALKVTSALHRIKIRAYYLEFKWKFKEKTGSHAIVLFEKKNKWFIVDNETAFPYEVKFHLSILEMIKEFCPQAYEVMPYKHVE